MENENHAVVQFSVTCRKTSNNICNGCHYIGPVAVLRLPGTCYGPGGIFRTEYKQYWLCRSCYSKLRKAMEGVSI